MAAKTEKDDTFDRPGQLNRDNVNPNAKHTNPPPPASGEMLSINEPPGSQPQAAAGDKEAKGEKADRDRGAEGGEDDDNGKKRKSHR